MSERIPRPKVAAQTERELWARAAGRCEFRGCNKLLYRDQLTQQRSNLANISHIVAFQPDGPRGHPVRSPQLATDIRNLVLTCRDHAKLIDDNALGSDYSEELLLEFKREHEERIRILTEAKEDARTNVILVQAAIDGRSCEIDQHAAFQAILPKYPAKEGADIINLSGIVSATAPNQRFEVMADTISFRVRELLRPPAGGRRATSYSVFALAPIPLLVHLGLELGDIEHVDLYQRHRDSQDWTWREAEAEPAEFFDILYPSSSRVKGQPVALLLSVSAHVDHAHLAPAIGSEPLLYEIRARDPGLDFLRTRKRLEIFGYEIRKLLAVIRDQVHDLPVHVFAAVPAPVAIEFGRHIKAYHPPFVTYEYQKRKRTYVPALTVNVRNF